MCELYFKSWDKNSPISANPDYQPKYVKEYMSISNDVRFLKDSVKDLKQKLEDGSEYSLSKASGIINILMNDEGRKLLKKLSMEYKHKLSFKVLKNQGPPIDMKLIKLQFISLRGPEEKLEEVKITKFQKLTCIRFQEKFYSVSDLIKVFRNIYGGAHRRNPRREKKQEEFMELKKVFEDTGIFDPAHQAIKSIGLIVAEASEELIKVIDYDKKDL